MSEQREIEVSVVSTPENSQCSSTMGSPGPSPHHLITTSTSTTGPISFHPISRTSSSPPESPSRKSPSGPRVGSPTSNVQAKASSPLYTSFSISSILSRTEPSKKLNASLGHLQQTPPQHPSVVEAATTTLHPCADTAMLSR